MINGIRQLVGAIAGAALVMLSATSAWAQGQSFVDIVNGAPLTTQPFGAQDRIAVIKNNPPYPGSVAAILGINLTNPTSLTISPKPVATLLAAQPQAAGGTNLLAFSTTTGVAVGQIVQATNIPFGDQVQSVVSTAKITRAASGSFAGGQAIIPMSVTTGFAVGQQCVDAATVVIAPGSAILSIQSGVSITLTRNTLSGSIGAADSITCYPTVTLSAPATSTVTTAQSIAFIANASAISAASAFVDKGDASIYGNLFVGGGLVLDGATGGSQGPGTINMTGCYVNGVPGCGGASSGMLTSGTNALSSALDAIATNAGQTGGLAVADSPTFANLSTSSNTSVFGQLLLSGTINGGINALHPNGGGYFDEWITDSVGLVSGDCTTVPVHIDISGTPTTGDVAVGFVYNDNAGHSTAITTVPTTGETNAQIASALASAFQVNSTIATIFAGKCPDGVAVSKIVGNAFAGGSTFYFNQFWPEQGSATTTALNSAHTTITVSQGGPQLENNPYLSGGRFISGRTPIGGDLLMTYYAIGGDTSNVLNTQYGAWFTSIRDPTPGETVGNLQFVEASGSGIALQGDSSNACCAENGGAVLYGTLGTRPTNVFMGGGTWNVPVGYYVNGLSGFAVVGSNPSLGIGTAPNANMPLDVLAANGGNGQARFRYGSGLGLLIDQGSSGGKTQLVQQANATLSFASNNSADNLTINSAGHVSMGRDNSADQGAVQAEVYGPGGFSVRYDTGLGFLLKQGYSAGWVSMINQANAPLYLGANNATVMTLLAGAQLGSPTGGDEGAGTLNLAGALYNNGTAPTGSGAYVLNAGPVFVTPTLGVASASSLALTIGTVTNVPTPVNPTDAVNKAYVDSASSGLIVKTSVQYATAAALAANTYNNGSSGVGATLTGNSNGAIVVDGVTPSVGNRILVKNEVTPANNGVYSVTTVGNAGAEYVLTRTTDYNTSALIVANTYFFVQSGNTNAGTGWIQQTTGTITVGTTNIVFAQFLSSATYTAGAGLTLAGSVFSIGAAQVTDAMLAATTGSGAVALATSPTFVTPALGTPASGVLTHATGLPISTGVSGLGTNVATLLGGNASGSGGPAGTTSPTFVTPVLGVAAGTSLALGGATIGGNALAVTGTVLLNTPLSLASGGTNASLTASNGGILYSTASAGAILAGTATAGLPLLSGSSTTPIWGTLNGSGNIVATTSASLVTPALGVATATSINGISITASTGTLTVGTGTATFPAAHSGTVAELNLAQSWTAPQRTNTETPAISTSTFTPVFSTGQNHRIDLSHSACPCTIANPAALVAGQQGVFEIAQSSTGGDTIGTWGSDYEYPGGTVTIVLSTAANAVDYVPYYVDSTGTYIVLGGVLADPSH